MCEIKAYKIAVAQENPNLQKGKLLELGSVPLFGVPVEE